MSHWKLKNDKLLDLVCVSHTVNVIGKKLEANCTFAKYFIHKWSELMNCSDYAREIFASNAGGLTVYRISEVRWFSFYEVVVQVRQNFGRGWCYQRW